MSISSAPGLTPSEVAFLAKSELISIIPRQRLESISLLGGTTPALRPPLPADLPLWLALLLKRQGRANIIAPPWLSVSSLSDILAHETSAPSFAPAPPLQVDPKQPTYPSHDISSGSSGSSSAVISPPFQPTSTRFADPRRLPYHFLSVAHLLLEAAEDDIPEAEGVRRLLRDVREARAAKLRKGVEVLDGGRVAVLNGVGALEVAEQGAFIRGVVDGLRIVGASKEVGRRERERDGGGRDGGLGAESEEEDEEML